MTPEFQQAYARWLGDVRPARPLLPREVLMALAGAHLSEDGPVRVVADLRPTSSPGCRSWSTPATCLRN